MATPPTVRPVQYIAFTADVHTAQIGRLRSALMQASNQGMDIYLFISSSGGNVAEGMGLAAFMKTLPVTITTHNIGQTDSVANVIFAAGTRRIANQTASFLFHGVTMHFEKIDFIESQLQEQYIQIRRLRENIATAYSTYTGLSLAETETLMISGATILSAQEALQKAIIHEIRDGRVPPGIQIVAIGNA